MNQNKIVRLILIQRGVSKSGNPYCRISVKAKRENGSSVMTEFWLDDAVSTKMISDGVQEEDTIEISLSLNDNLRPVVSGIAKVDDELSDLF